MKTKGIVFIVSILAMLSTSSVYAQKTVINKDQLPQKAQSFITNYFSNQNVNYIIKDNEINSVDYDVHFSSGMEIEFDAEGDWKEIDGEYQPIPTGFISKKVINYINSQYPNTHVIKIEKDPFKQEVKISNGLELEFTTSGDFVRMDD